MTRTVWCCHKVTKHYFSFHKWQSIKLFARFAIHRLNQDPPTGNEVNVGLTKTTLLHVYIAFHVVYSSFPCFAFFQVNCGVLLQFYALVVLMWTGCTYVVFIYICNIVYNLLLRTFQAYLVLLVVAFCSTLFAIPEKNFYSWWFS